MRSTYRAIVVEDEPRILAHLAQKISKLDAQFEVVGTARNGQDALTLAKQLRPDVVFSDVYMPRMDGIALSAQLKVLPNAPKVVIISGFQDFAYAREAMRNGVCDYLLKPVSDEELTGVLKRIAEQLRRTFLAGEIEAVRAAATGRLSAAAVPQGLADARFRAILLNVGGHLGPIPDAIHERIVACILEDMDYRGALKQAGATEDGWWVCDGLSQAQRFIVLDASQGAIDAQGLLSSLGAASCGYAVTLSASEKECELLNLQEELRSLAAALSHRISPGHSAYFIASGKPALGKSLLGMEQFNLFKGHLQVQRWDLARRQLGELLNGWARAKYPQYLVESDLRQLIRTLAPLSPQAAEEGGAYLAEHAVLSAVCAARQLPEALDAIWSALEDLMLKPVPREDYSGKTADDIEAYLKANYAEALTVESIAQRAGFNAVYLNRIFKKHKHVTLIQYLINLRIEKAKQLMLEHPEWDFSLVGESIGYNDPHYFSRAFKKNTGQSPTEWRQAQEC